MIKIRMVRYSPEGFPATLGVFTYLGKMFYTLEPEDTFLRPGTVPYRCVRRPATKNTPAGIGEAFEIQGVANHDAVLFGHVGNKVENTRGCVLFGLASDGTGPMVQRSIVAIQKFFSLVGEEKEIELTIESVGGRKE